MDQTETSPEQGVGKTRGQERAETSPDLKAGKTRIGPRPAQGSDAAPGRRYDRDRPSQPTLRKTPRGSHSPRSRGRYVSINSLRSTSIPAKGEEKKMLRLCVSAT
jgi:hypothetical protein